MSFYCGYRNFGSQLLQDGEYDRQGDVSLDEITLFRSRLLKLRARLLELRSPGIWRGLLLRRIESLERVFRDNEIGGELMWDALDVLALAFSAYNHEFSSPTELMTNKYGSGGRLVIRFTHIYNCALPGKVMQPFFDRYLFPSFSCEVARLVKRRRDVDMPCNGLSPGGKNILIQSASYEFINAFYVWFCNNNQDERREGSTLQEIWDSYTGYITDEERAYDLCLTWFPVHFARSRIDPATLDWDEFLRALRAIYSVSLCAESMEEEFERLVMVPLRVRYIEYVRVSQTSSPHWEHSFEMWRLDQSEYHWWNVSTRRTIQRVLLGVEDEERANTALTRDCLVDVAHLLHYVDTYKGSYLWLDYISHAPDQPTAGRYRRSRHEEHRPEYGIKWNIFCEVAARRAEHMDLVGRRLLGEGGIIWFRPTGADRFVVNEVLRRSGTTVSATWERDLMDDILTAECGDNKQLSIIFRKHNMRGWITGTGATDATVPVLIGNEDNMATLPMTADMCRIEAFIHTARVYDLYRSKQRPCRRCLLVWVPHMYDIERNTGKQLETVPLVSPYILKTYGGLNAANDVLFSGKHMPNTAALELGLLDALCRDGVKVCTNYADEWDALVSGYGANDAYVRLCRLYYAYEERGRDFLHDILDIVTRWYTDPSLAQDLNVALSNLVPPADEFEDSEDDTEEISHHLGGMTL